MNGADHRDVNLMAENSNKSAVLIVPVVLIGLVGAGVVFYRQPTAPDTVAPVTVDETRVVSLAIHEANASLPAGSSELGMAERHLLLRLNDSLERRLEVAGGLYAVASKHLDAGRAPEAMRVAQVCADVAPGSLLEARCWILCGHASAVTHPDLPLSIRYYERADVALGERLQRSADDEETLRLRASAVLWLAQTKDRCGRTDEAIQHLRELTASLSLVQAQLPADRLQTMLTLGLLLHKTGLGGQANRMLTEAQKLGLSDAVPASEALHALVDSTRRQWPEITDPARQDALRQLWDTPRFQTLPEWFPVGDELASAYFFAEPRQRADFELVSRELLTSLPGVLASLPDDSEQRAELESLYATNLLLAVDSANARSDASEATRLITLFEKRFQGRDIQFASPLDRPAQRMHRIGEIYRTTMTGHVEQLRQIHATGTAPR